MKERRYHGIFKIYGNQRRQSARQARERCHLERPVAWLRSARPDSIVMRAIGRPMDVPSALAEETIQTASGLVDGGVPCRGGPWAHPKLGSRGLAEAGEVRRLAGRASSASAARVAVLEYATGLDDKSYLKRRCLDLPFRRDSAEKQMGPARKKSGRTGGSSLSGNRKRKSWGYRPGTSEYNEHKWGSDVKKNRSRDNQKQAMR